MMPIAGRPRGGLSLIELLVVVAILAAVAGMVISMAGNVESRSRYDDTSRRLAEIRSAVLGPDAVSADGSLLSGGYLQDVGWLPDASADLLRAPEISPGVPMPALRYDPAWRTWTGWRGPYLAAPPLRKGDAIPALYDGWGNDFYGWFSEGSAARSWEIPRLSGDCAVRSAGADGVRDDAGGKTGVFDLDLPVAVQPLVREAEWRTDLRGLRVEVENLTATDYSASPVAARFRIIVPRWDRSDPLGGWPASPDADEFIGREFTLDAKGVSDPSGGNRRVYAFGDPDRPLRVPHGRRMMFLVRSADGRPLDGVSACAELNASRRVAPPSLVRLSIRN